MRSLSAQKAAGSFAVEVGKQIEEIGWILDEAGNTRFVSVIRPSDTVARLGGDEFVVLCEDLATDRVEAENELLEIADRLHRVLQAPIGEPDAPQWISASIGSHVIVGTGDPIREALGNADVAMYRAKALGRSRTEVFDEALRRVAQLAEAQHGGDIVSRRSRGRQGCSPGPR